MFLPTHDLPYKLGGNKTLSSTRSSSYNRDLSCILRLGLWNSISIRSIAVAGLVPHARHKKSVALYGRIAGCSISPTTNL